MRKRILLTVLTVAMLLGGVMTVSAGNSDDECDCLKNGLPVGVVFYKCNKEKQYKGIDSHQYGFLWANTCEYKYYKSTSTEYCSSCNHNYNEDDKDWHECVIKHGACGGGTEDVCMIAAMNPWEMQSEEQPADESR